MFDFDVRSGHDTPAPRILAGISVLHAFRDQLTEAVIKVPRRAPLLLSPVCTLGEALRLMSARHAAAAVVASHGVLLGMLDERELVRRMLDPTPPTADLPIWKVMAADPETLLDSDPVAYAVRKLWTLGGRAMPIVSPSGALVGVLETQDVVAWMCERLGASGDGEHGNG